MNREGNWHIDFLFSKLALYNRLTNCMLTKIYLAILMAVSLSYSLFSQVPESFDAPIIVCPVGEYSGSHYTPTPDHILNNMLMRSANDPCANITVTYNNFPAAAQEAFQAAVDIWAYSLSSSVTIRITANWTFLASNLLGSAGSSYVYRNFANAPDDRYYGSALADQIAGYDLAPTEPDIIANFNSLQNWYFGLDGGGTFSQFDLVSVVLHELGHGFGFASSFGYSGGNGSYGVGANDIPMAYDEMLILGQSGSPLVSLAEGSVLGNALTSNNVYCNGNHATDANGGNHPRFYAPVSFNFGSSISHLNEFTYLAGSENSLMTPSMGPSEVIHNPGPIALGVLQDLGWVLCDGAPDAEPCISWTQPSSTSGSQIFNDTFDGAPCDFGNGCPTFEISNQVTAGTAYDIDNFQQGGVYTFSICNGPNAGSWVPEFTIMTPLGGVDAFGPGIDECSITWTATQSGTYTIIVNEANNCGIANSTLNGYPSLECQDGTAICDPAMCSIGVLQLQGPQAICPDQTFSLSMANTPSVPVGGGVGLRFINSDTQAEILLQDVNLPFVFDNLLNGALPANGISNLEGDYEVSAFVYSEADDFEGTICGNSPQSISIGFLSEFDPQCGGDPCMADTESPVAVCANITTSLNASGLKTIGASLVNLGSTDNCPDLSFQLSKTQFTCDDLGENSVTLTVTDLAGNADFCVSNITVVDLLSPSLTAPPNLTVTANIGNCAASSVELGNPVFSDNCSATVSNNAPEIFPVGINPVVWQAVDQSGNIRTRTQYVTVLEDEFINLTISVNGSSTICQGESVTLTATPGFESYEWSNGESSSEIVVNTAGLYSVNATMSDNCDAILSDEIEIVVLPDSDGDGVCDVDDDCPDDPNKIEAGSCGCGVPDLDTDNDQIPDCIDMCPELALAIGEPCDDGDPLTGNDKVRENCECVGSQLWSQLDGLVEWNPICGSRQIKFEFYEPNTDILVDQYFGLIGETGDYSVPEVVPGVYDIYFKVKGFLARGIYSFETDPGINVLYVGSIIPGDINDDNVVNISDLSLLNWSYGSQDGNTNFSIGSDLNCDGAVNVIDLSILSPAFGTIGDQPD